MRSARERHARQGSAARVLPPQHLRHRLPIVARGLPLRRSLRAAVARSPGGETADAADLKSAAPRGAWGFDSLPEHQERYAFGSTFSIAAIRSGESGSTFDGKRATGLPSASIR